MKSFVAKPADIERKWYVIDANGQTLGRLATQVAMILRGKHKPIYTPHVDCGDHVIVINAGKVVLTGKKLEQKKYYRYSGYVGGLKETSAKDMLEKKPELMVYEAIKGMMPKNSLGREMLTKLRVYKDAEHAHAAQKPEVYTL
ncbi:MAG: 50S ribosomal protein L13 [Clostridiales bacterium]|nr:50S ribosomal protein L13 [Clostridiales bacterium]